VECCGLMKLSSVRSFIVWLSDVTARPVT